MRTTLVNSCTPGRGILVWNPSILERIANRPNAFDVRDNMSRVRFFSNGAYSYAPSNDYIKAYAKYKLKNKILH